MRSPLGVHCDVGCEATSSCKTCTQTPLPDTWDDGNFAHMGERHVSEFFISACDRG